MTSSLSYWETYKTSVQKTFQDFGNNTPVVLTLGLASEIGELFGVTQKEIIKKKNLKNERILEVGDILWYIAAFEIYYGLPYPRYATYIGMSLEMGGAEQINVLDVQADAFICSSEITSSTAVGDLDEISYNLNKLFAVLFDICIVYDINIVDCMNASANKGQTRHPEGYNPEAVKQHRKECLDTRKSIKAKNVSEALFEVKINKKLKKYLGLTLHIEGKEFKFYNKDLIEDFFTASNYLADNYARETYLINYSPNFREILSELSPNLVSGYINGNNLITAQEVQKSLKKGQTSGNVIFSGNAYRPILMTSRMKTLDDLLAYINKVRDIVKHSKTEKKDE